MNFTYFISQFFALVASVLYLMIFLFIIHNVIIRTTRYNSRLSKAVIATGFLVFTAVLYTIMGYYGFGEPTFVLPSHLFVLGLTWAEYYRVGKQDENNG